MATEGFKRKLAAVFSADVAGCSRFMDDILVLSPTCGIDNDHRRQEPWHE